MCTFRLLRPDEIECRIGQVKANGVSLLLYKDARCDMAILDETIGSLNWQRRHEFKDGKLYCTVSIYDKEKGQWIDKEDVGVESNTEAEKGQASDSFKRACVNWGIGRELYTSPFIWVSPNQGEDLKRTKFSVLSITYDDKNRIDSLVIVDDKGNARYTFPRAQATKQPSEKPQRPLRERIIDYLKSMNDKTRKEYLSYFQIQDLDKLTDKQANDIAEFEKKKKAQEKQQ